MRADTRRIIALVASSLRAGKGVRFDTRRYRAAPLVSRELREECCTRREELRLEREHMRLLREENADMRESVAAQFERVLNQWGLHGRR